MTLVLVAVALAGVVVGWVARDLIVTWPRRQVGEIDTTRRRQR